MSEWLKEPVSKTGEGASSPRVRIPPSPIWMSDVGGWKSGVEGTPADLSTGDALRARPVRGWVAVNRSKPGEIERLYRYFWRAVRRRRPKTILRLIRRHPDLHEFEGDAGTLVEVLSRDSPRLLERAFRAGLSPNAVGVTQQTPLQSAVATGDLRCIRLLLRYGADPDARNDWDEVALGYAATWGQLEPARLLVAAGADVNSVEIRPGTGRGTAPLDCCGRNVEIAEYLRSQGGKTLHELLAVEEASTPFACGRRTGSASPWRR